MDYAKLDGTGAILCLRIYKQLKRTPHQWVLVYFENSM